MTDKIINDATSILDDKDLKSMLKFDITDDDFKSMSNSIEFSGYDPVVTFNIIMKLMGKDSDKKKQLFLLIIFGLTRGFGNGKSKEDILSRTSEDGRASLESALAFFRVQFGKVKNKRAITISRILTAFPVLVFKFHAKLISTNKKQKLGYTGELPEHFQYPGSPAMMNETTWAEQEENYIGYVYFLAELWDAEYDEDDARRFAKLAHDSVLAPDNVRS